VAEIPGSLFIRLLGKMGLEVCGWNYHEERAEMPNGYLRMCQLQAVRLINIQIITNQILPVI
jgi:hypothetical protein